MCGIFGIITPKPRKLDTRAFCVLGVNNDSRGGDSCGVFIDKRYEYGINEFKLFYNFFPRSKVINTTNKCQIALGHCRKASVGAINAANAQPVVIKDELGDVKFVLIHNGTIINYHEMAQKYIPTVDIKNMTDSQVMARIFYHAGYEVLGEYLGAGAFVMVDYRKAEPEVFFFKGESKPTQYSTVIQVERPLFCTYSTTEFIFSSIMDYLKALRPGRETMTILPNKLIQLKDGKLVTIKEYDRHSLWQTRSYYSSDYSTNTAVCNISRRSTDYLFPTEFSNRYWDEVVEMDKHGTYWIGTLRAHGLFYVDAIGNVEQRKKVGTIQVAFWKGVLLKTPACFTFLSKFAKDMEASQEELLSSLPDLVHYLSPCACWKNHKGIWVTSETANSNTVYTGNAIFPFTTEEVSFLNGVLTTYTDGITYKEALQDLQKFNDYKIDYNAICKCF